MAATRRLTGGLKALKLTTQNSHVVLGTKPASYLPTTILLTLEHFHSRYPSLELYGSQGANLVELTGTHEEPWRTPKLENPVQMIFLRASLRDFHFVGRDIERHVHPTLSGFYFDQTLSAPFIE